MLIENPGSPDTVNHLGVEVVDTAAVDAVQRRVSAAGLASTDERSTSCCYATQDKFWVEAAPGGERWEVYTVLADSETFGGDGADRTVCCGTTVSEELQVGSGSCC